MLDSYAVIGNPISHSKSPLIHTHFAKQTGEDLTYSTLLAPVDGFTNTVEMFQISGGKGLNITVPFKLDAYNLADNLNDLATRAKAVNTLIINDDGSLTGANTDGIGIIRDLRKNHHIDLAEKSILVLGAGGAVRGILQPLLKEKPATVMIANRTTEKAIALAKDFSDLGDISGGGFDDIGTKRFDLIINGTAASLQGEVPPIPESCLAEQGSCYDMMYSADNDTAFVTWAKQHNATNALDGLGMLIEQAAESFYLWRKIRPDTQPVFEALRNK